MKLSKYIDHTLLKQDATKKDIEKLINEAIEYDFATVCVNPSWVEYSKKLLSESIVGITAVIGFPLGAMTTESKAFEAKDAVMKGATEIDMVINIGKLKDGEYEYVLNDINEVKKSIKDTCLKVIIETCLLTKEEIIKVSEIVKKSNANFIKTSTGFSTSGATVENIKLMSGIVSPDKGVKAAGGVKTPQDLQDMIDAGATRIGTSQGVNLMKGEKAGEGY